MTREETPQRANCEVMAVLSQSGADFGQGQIVFLGNQRMNTRCLRFDMICEVPPENVTI